MNKALKDTRGAAAAVALIGSIVGFVLLVALNHQSDAEHLLATVAAPALMFIVGLGSEPVSAT
jgi:uncharacterized membrane protein YdcZ (DUF606 family)